MYTIIKHTRKPATIEDLLASKKGLDKQPMERMGKEIDYKEAGSIIDAMIAKHKAQK